MKLQDIRERLPETTMADYEAARHERISSNLSFKMLKRIMMKISEAGWTDPDYRIRRGKKLDISSNKKDIMYISRDEVMSLLEKENLKSDELGFAAANPELQSEAYEDVTYRLLDALADVRQEQMAFEVCLGLCSIALRANEPVLLMYIYEEVLNTPTRSEIQWMIRQFVFDNQNCPDDVLYFIGDRWDAKRPGAFNHTHRFSDSLFG